MPSNGESKALGQQEPGVPRGFADLSPQIAAAVASARNMLRFPWGHRIITLKIGVYEEHFCEVPAMRATQENRLLRALHFSMPDPAFPSHMVGGIQAVYGNAIITGLLLGSAFPPRFPSVRVVSYGVQEWLASQTRGCQARLLRNRGQSPDILQKLTAARLKGRPRNSRQSSGPPRFLWLQWP